MSPKLVIPETRPFFQGKFWPPHVPHQVEYDNSLVVGDLVTNAAKQWPSHPVMWFLDSWMTFQELKENSDQLARALVAFGLQKGDVVALDLPNSFQYVIAYYAILSVGGILTPVNPTYKSAEIAHQFTLTHPKFLITLDILWDTSIRPIADEFNLTKIIYTNLVDLATGLSGLKKWLGRRLGKIPHAKVTHPKAISLLDCLQNDFPVVTPCKISPETDLAVLMMTGGTTGDPKPAMLTHANIVANTHQVKDWLVNQQPPQQKQNLGLGTGCVGVLPLFHSFAMCTIQNISFLIGSWMMLFPRPPPTEEVLALIKKLPNRNGFVYCGVEILFQRISELPLKEIQKYDLDQRLQLCVSAAGPLHEYVRIPFEEKTGAKLTEGYGLAEASPCVSSNNFEGPRRPGSIGCPFPGTDWAIFPTDNFEAGPIEGIGEEFTGEICIHGPQVMQGYYENPEETANTIKEYRGKRWLLTGDIGYLDDAGRVVIRDRKKQLIKYKGYSVYPKEVESLLGKHPDILEVAVAGIPDKEAGEVIKAWISLKPKSIGKVSVNELITWAKSNLTHYKIPRYMEIISQIPKNAIGKVMRRTLQTEDPLYKDPRISAN